MVKNLISWTGKNIDPVLALLAAVVIGSLDIFSDAPSSTVSSGILFVLGVLSVSILRDRLRRDDAERELRAELRRAGDVGPALAAMAATAERANRALEDVSMVRTLTGSEVTQVLESARATTDRWIFRGGTGTYIRAVTLPQCVANARDQRRTLQVRLEIIDPTDERVCASYVRFRQALEGDQSGWTIERTQRESYATIVACCWYRQRYDLLDVEIGLSGVMPTLRWDMSQHSLVITQESPRNPALLVGQGKLLYTYLQTELRKSLEQARPVPLERARTVTLSAEPTVDEIRALFVALDMPLPSSLTDRDIHDIVVRALHARNPYS